MSDENKSEETAGFLSDSTEQKGLMLEKNEPKYFEEFSWYWSLAGRGKINRRIVLGLMGGFVGGLSLLLSRGLRGAAEAAEKDNRVATALFAEGILTVIRPDGSKKRLAGQGSLPLFEGDKLQTGRISQGYITFVDGTSMALNANTTITIRSRKDSKGVIQVIKLFIGEIWAEIGEKKQRFEVETPNALAAVSGTEFGKKYEEEISTLTVGEGEMDFGATIMEDELMDEIDPINRTVVGAGHQSLIHKHGRPSLPVMVNTDTILNWGRSLHARFRPRKAKHRGGLSRAARFRRQRERDRIRPSGNIGSIINPY